MSRVAAYLPLIHPYAWSAAARERVELVGMTRSVYGIPLMSLVGVSRSGDKGSVSLSSYFMSTERIFDFNRSQTFETWGQGFGTVPKVGDGGIVGSWSSKHVDDV